MAQQTLQLADFIGLDVCLAILTVMYDGSEKPEIRSKSIISEYGMAKNRCKIW